jgi:hypothetical protein
MKSILFAFLALTLNTAIANTVATWTTVKGENKFGEKYEYQQLKGKTTQMWIHKGETVMSFRQEGAIECDGWSWMKLKIDDQPVQDISLRVQKDCKTMVLNPNDDIQTVTDAKHKSIATKVISDLLKANKIVIQLNEDDGIYKGKTEVFTVKK